MKPEGTLIKCKLQATRCWPLLGPPAVHPWSVARGALLGCSSCTVRPGNLARVGRHVGPWSLELPMCREVDGRVFVEMKLWFTLYECLCGISAKWDKLDKLDRCRSGLNCTFRSWKPRDLACRPSGLPGGVLGQPLPEVPLFSIGTWIIRGQLWSALDGWPIMAQWFRVTNV